MTELTFCCTKDRMLLKTVWFQSLISSNITITQPDQLSSINPQQVLLPQLIKIYASSTTAQLQLSRLQLLLDSLDLLLPRSDLLHVPQDLLPGLVVVALYLLHLGGHPLDYLALSLSEFLQLSTVTGLQFFFELFHFEPTLFLLLHSDIGYLEISDS